MPWPPPPTKNAQPNITDFAIKKCSAQRSPERLTAATSEQQETDNKMLDINAMSQFLPLPSAPDSKARTSAQIDSHHKLAHDGDDIKVMTCQDIDPHENETLPVWTNKNGHKESQGLYISKDIADDMLGYDDHLESIEAYADCISRDKMSYVISLSKEAKQLADKVKAKNAKWQKQLRQEYKAQAAERSSSNKSISQNIEASSETGTETLAGQNSTDNTPSPANPYKQKSSSTIFSPVQSILRTLS